MAQFLQAYGFELILIIYGIFSTIVNLLTFRRTGSTNKIIRGSDISSGDQVSTVDGKADTKAYKAIVKIEKARSKLEKLLSKFDNSDNTNENVPKDGA